MYDVTRKILLREYLHELYRRRDFILFVPFEAVRAANARMILGSLWHLLSPTLLIATYYVIFGLVLDVNRGVPNAISFLAVGVFFFRFVERSVIQGGNSIAGNIGLIRSIYFPRAVLPIQASIRQLIEFAVALVPMFLFVILTGDLPRWSWIWLPVVIIAATLLGLGGGLAAAYLQSVVEDITNILPVLFRVAFFGSGVIFPVALRIESQTLRNVFNVNPFHALLSVARTVLLGYELNGGALCSLLVWSVLSPVIGFWVFRRKEHVYGG